MPTLISEQISGGGLVLVHGLGIVIGRYVVSTGSLTVYQGVTIGRGNGRNAPGIDNKTVEIKIKKTDMTL